MNVACPSDGSRVAKDFTRLVGRFHDCLFPEPLACMTISLDKEFKCGRRSSKCAEVLGRHGRQAGFSEECVHLPRGDRAFASVSIRRTEQTPPAQGSELPQDASKQWIPDLLPDVLAALSFEFKQDGVPLYHDVAL